MLPTKNDNKVRVYALAKTLGIESKVIIDLCTSLGYDVKNQLSSLEPDQVDILRTRMTKGGPTKPAEPVRAAPPAQLPRVEKKIVSIVAPRPKVEAPAPVDEAPAPVEVPVVVPPIAVEPPMVVAPTPVPESIPTPIPEVVAETPVVRPPVSKILNLTPQRQPRPQVQPPVAVVEEPAVVAEVVAPPAVVAEPEPPAIVVEKPVVAEVIAPLPTVAPEPVVVPQAVVADVEPVAPTQPTAQPSRLGPVAPRTPAPIRQMNNLNSGNRPRPLTPMRPQGAVPPAAAAQPPTNPTPPPTAKPNPPARPPLGSTPNLTRSGPPQPPGSGRPVSNPQGGGPGGSGPMGQRRTMGQPGGRGAGGQTGGGAGGSGTLRRPDDRRPGGNQGSGPQSQQGPGKAPPAAPKPPQGPTRFTPEQLARLRSGGDTKQIIKEITSPTPAPTGAPANQGPGRPGFPPPPMPEGGEEEKPGKVVGRDDRHKERAKRQELRKVRSTNIVIGSGGHVDLIEDDRVRRRKKLIKKMKLPGTIERKGKVPITLPITVRSLSEAIGMKVAQLLFKMKEVTNALYTINSSVDVEVAELIAAEHGVEFEIIKPRDAEEELFDKLKLSDDPNKLVPRAPIVTIMGHVDHGKTSLLDKIRKSNVVATEAGGITQVIRAWRVMRNDRTVTFLDTPGHEAFTKMRARGALVTDIAVIVVAANDGVMPQTEEAISHAQAAGVSIVVAINKIDLPDANIKRTEQQLYGKGLLPDTMGGDCQFVYTSAAKGIGIDELLDTLLLVADVKELTADPTKPALGTCLEANLSGDEGVMATLLVQQGTLRKGEVVLCGSTFGRVRAMYDDLGRPINEAGPTVPVRITGLDEVPNADDHFHVVMELAQAREIAGTRKVKQLDSAQVRRIAVNLENLGEQKTKIAELKVILKAEARGSVEAIRKELEKLVHDEVRVRLLHAGIGAITESDIQLALTSPEDSIVVGFNVVPDDNALRLAGDRDVKIREYNIIYKLTQDIKAALEGKLKPREEVIHLGRALVRDTFRISRVGTVAGCYVTQGTIERSGKIRVIRDGAVIYPPPERTAGLDSLKRFKEDVKEVREGFDCGIKVAGYDDIKSGDVIEAYRIEQVLRTL